MTFGLSMIYGVVVHKLIGDLDLVISNIVWESLPEFAPKYLS